MKRTIGGRSAEEEDLETTSVVGRHDHGSSGFGAKKRDEGNESDEYEPEGKMHGE
ncbi:hypothetical protein ASA1KI_24450 [Opitutales bacterium ASA1]|nr:hypothetical protein ASA1KI_24450 [Opitutales bacterium ASA1]